MQKFAGLFKLIRIESINMEIFIQQTIDTDFDMMYTISTNIIKTVLIVYY